MHIKKKPYLLLALVLLASYFLVPHASWLPISVGVAASLVALFFGRERVEDERVVHLKFKALGTGFVVAFALAGAWVLRFDDDVAPRSSLSAFDYVIVTMSVALGLFYYWRWQDARAPEEANGGA